MSTITREAHVIPDLELAGTLMTPEEFDAIEEADENYRYELIRGVLVVSPLPSVEVRDANEELGSWLRNYREGHPQGSALDRTVYEQTVPVLQDRRRADRVIWSGLGRRPDLGVDIPTIVVEFVSAGKRNRRRDYEQKRQEYMAAGVAEYWIIDRFRRHMTVVRNGPEGAQEIVVGEADVYRTPLLPGFELPLGRLLALADDWATSE
jgi:Uma2 family endonuclease